MKRSEFLSAFAATASLSLLLGPTAALGQAFPSRPVRIVVPFPPGGSMDLVARLIADPMSRTLGQPVIVENRAGAGGQLASAFVAKAAPDGYTLLITNPGPATVSMALNPKLAYNSATDFAPVSLASVSPMVLCVGAGSKYRSVADIIAAAKAQPGKLNFASTGNGTLSHLVLSLLGTSAGISATHVPYKGGAEIITAVLAGDVDYFVAAPSDVVSFVKSGKLRALGVTSAQRSALMPEVPTVAEAALPGFEVSYWIGVLAPAKTPPAVVAALNRAIAQAVDTPEMKVKMAGVMAEALSSTPERLQGLIRADIEKWTRVAQSANIKSE